jgi:hypothetical protein
MFSRIDCAKILLIVSPWFWMRQLGNLFGFFQRKIQMITKHYPFMDMQVSFLFNSVHVSSMVTFVFYDLE